MKAKIFMFLFVFAMMYVIFQYANSKRYYKAKEKEINDLEQKIDTLEAQLKGVRKGDFSLKTNRDARTFFEDQGINVDSLAAKIEQKIIAKNSVKKDNPLVPYAGVSGVTRIDHIHILNGRWVIAKFTDGKHWGEALISYYLDQHHQLQFDTLDGMVYPPSK